MIVTRVAKPLSHASAVGTRNSTALVSRSAIPVSTRLRPPIASTQSRSTESIGRYAMPTLDPDRGSSRIPQDTGGYGVTAGRALGMGLLAS